MRRWEWSSDGAHRLDGRRPPARTSALDLRFRRHPRALGNRSWLPRQDGHLRFLEGRGLREREPTRRTAHEADAVRNREECRQIGSPKCHAELEIETSAFDSRFPRVDWEGEASPKLWWAKTRLAGQVIGPYLRQQQRSPSILTIGLVQKNPSSRPAETMLWIADRLPVVLEQVHSPLFGAGALNRYGDPLSLPHREGIGQAEAAERDKTFDRVQAVMLLPNGLARSVRASSSVWVERRGRTHSVFRAVHLPTAPGGDMPAEGWQDVIAGRPSQEDTLENEEHAGRLSIAISGGGSWNIRFGTAEEHPLREQYLGALLSLGMGEVELLSPLGARASGLIGPMAPRIALRRDLAAKLKLALENRLRGHEASTSTEVHLDVAIAAMRDAGVDVSEDDGRRFKRIAGRYATKH